MLVRSLEACLLQRRFVVGEVGSAQTGQEAEGEVEDSDVEAAREVEKAGGDAEVGVEPEGSRGQVRRQFGDEGFEFGLGKAVKEEVGGDQVCFPGDCVFQGAVIVCVEAMGSAVNGRFAALAEKLKHGGAGVYRVGVYAEICLEELGEEATVSIAEYQGLFSVEQV